MIAVLIVCRGNICRSPALQGCLQRVVQDHKKTESYYIDSCGVHSFFCGQEVDLRTKVSARKKGIELSHLARNFELADFTIFDYIFPVTQDIMQDLCELAPNEVSKKKIYLATHFSKLHKDKDIEDPYCGGEEGFNRMLDILSEVAIDLFHYLENTKTTFQP